jgi:hypothetical protein
MQARIVLDMLLDRSLCIKFFPAVSLAVIRQIVPAEEPELDIPIVELVARREATRMSAHVLRRKLTRLTLRAKSRTVFLFNGRQQECCGDASMISYQYERIMEHARMQRTRDPGPRWRRLWSW